MAQLSITIEARLRITVEAVVDERFAQMGDSTIVQHAEDVVAAVTQVVKGEDFASLLPAVEVSYSLTVDPPQKGSI